MIDGIMYGISVFVGIVAGIGVTIGVDCFRAKSKMLMTKRIFHLKLDVTYLK